MLRKDTSNELFNYHSGNINTISHAEIIPHQYYSHGSLNQISSGQL